ncbi:site-specific integrase [uncultured Bacteroides sp.]|uniref:site-specific integrase n=1 Tax=uncultured Bacteroides sp. TaxID=162156 RepID=UPI0026369929|nr:site-specific integrase [uncultured Bacteroides sp.]
MEKIYFRLVFNSENNLNADTLGTVVIEARQFSEKVYLPTNVSLKPEYWNSYSQEVNSTHPNHELLNRYLQECILKLEWQELKMWKNDTPMTLEQLTMPDSWCNEAKESSFLNFCKEYIHISRKRESTKRNLMTTVKVLSLFNYNTTFNNITYEYIMNFEKFLFARKYKINTIIKHIKHLRSFYNEAVNRKLINNSDDAFRRYKMLKGESQYTFLLPEELNKLEKLVLAKKNRNMQHTLDAFLFCCYTGLRYSDFCSLTKDNLMNIDDKIWLMYKSVKTGVETRLPLYLLFNGKAISILNKYKHNMNSFFKISSNSSIDKELKRIKALAGVNTHISFHTARHTNATLLVYKGVNITTVQKLLGHKNIRTTQHYADILPQGIVKDLEKNA